MRGSFPTFCHIGDYGPSLYHNLESLIAVSDPLILWTPSAAMLQTYKSPVTPERLLGYVRSGRIKVIGRGPWLTDPAFRKQSRWEGAAWQNGFDDLIRDMAFRDDVLAFESRRVLIVPPERGFAKADELLATDSNLSSTIAQAIERKSLPPGTLGKALHRKENQGERAAVRVVLRDAINHADALTFSRAEAPFLQPEEGSFIGLMEMAADPNLETQLRSRKPTAKADRSTVDVIETALRLLKTLEPLNRSHHLDEFLASPARNELVEFIRQISNGYVEGSGVFLIESLRVQIEANSSYPDLSMGDAADKFVTAGSLALSALSLLGGVTAGAVAGVVFSAFPVGRNLLRRAGVLSPEYHGPLWPFLWHNGRKPTVGEIKTLLQRLEELKIDLLDGKH